MRVAVVFINIGSYHAARLNAAAQAFRPLGWDLEVIQVTGDTLEHAWGDFAGSLSNSVKLTTLFEHTPEAPSDWKRPFSREAAKRVWEHLSRIQPDAVLTPGWSFSVAVASLRWCKRHGKTAVLASESNEFDTPRRWWREWFKSRRLKLFSSALVGGKSHARYLVKLGFNHKKIAYGYDVVDNDSFNPERLRSLPRPHLRPYFLNVGRLISKKNLPFVLKAYAQYQIQARSKGWDLVFCGDGDMRNEMESLIRSEGLQDYVSLTGFLKPEELLPYFAHAGCLVHASTEEQWGLVVNEAMAAGLPVLVSRTCGCAEDLVCEGENGFTFDPADMAGLSKLLALVSTDTAIREKMGQASLRRIAAYPSSAFGQGLVQAVKLGSQY